MNNFNINSASQVTTLGLAYDYGTLLGHFSLQYYGTK